MDGCSTMQDADRRERSKSKNSFPGLSKQPSAEAIAASEGGPDMAPPRDSPSPSPPRHTTGMPMSDFSRSGDLAPGVQQQRPTIEPLPDSVAKPSREEIFSFPHSKRVGSYILGRTLGEGAFAKVKEGRHLLTGEKVGFYLLTVCLVGNG